MLVIAISSFALTALIQARPPRRPPQPDTVHENMISTAPMSRVELMAICDSLGTLSPPNSGRALFVKARSLCALDIGDIADLRGASKALFDPPTPAELRSLLAARDSRIGAASLNSLPMIDAAANAMTSEALPTSELGVALAVGAARFIAGRAKTIAIADALPSLITALCGPGALAGTTIERGSILPLTCQELRVLQASGGVTSPATLATLRSASQLDLRGLPAALLLTAPRDSTKAADFLNLLIFLDDIGRGRDPLVAIGNRWSASEATPVSTPGLSAVLFQAVSLVRAIRGVPTLTGWSKERAEWEFKLWEVNASDSTRALLRGCGENTTCASSRLNTLVALGALTQLEDALTALRAVTTDSVPGESGWSSGANGGTLLRTVAAGASALAAIPCTCDIGAHARLQEAVRFSEALARREYGLFVNLLLTSSLSPIPEASRDKAAATLSMIADFATADSAVQVEAALERWALPPGAYRAKRQLKGAVYVQAYFGLAGGVERANHSDETTPLFGLWMPIGVEYWSHQHGWMLQVLDLGAVAQFEAGATADEGVPPFALRTLLAPGIRLTESFGDHPFVWQIGYTYSPWGRERATDGSARPHHRLTFGVGIDVPLFNIYPGKRLPS